MGVFQRAPRARLTCLAKGPTVVGAADTSFILTIDFFWKVGLVTLVSCLPLFVFKWVRHRYAPPDASKLAAA